MMGDSESPLDNLVRRTSKRNETATTSYARLPPNSPLLHSDFARQSTATASSNTDNNSYLRSSYQESEFDYHRYYGYEQDEQSAARESWQTTRGAEEVPTVVVSSPDGQVPRAGRMAIVKPIGTNFSRPGRSVDDLQDQKRHVLERNRVRRTGSPVSLYSTYSYYPYDNAVPLPTGLVMPTPGSIPGNTPGSTSTATPRTMTTPTVTITAAPRERTSTAQEYLQLGIQHHEANRLRESAVCFEKSAKEGGGCGVGMLMWGLTLRHGWGCEKNEKVGFKWLRRAAESAVEDLESARGGGEWSAVQSELVLAIYEVGQCFFHGWGVVKDQKMAVSYYRVAAKIGDSDAQVDLAFCLANGKGCKKDKREAAKWYRAAVNQGQSDIGLAWIYKHKYQ